ncbi:MAG: hypothetical protein JWM51_732 [Microbacteriaceae bacterium]|nr:hypothetical protein [Microbacteriaceae bacterium]
MPSAPSDPALTGDTALEAHTRFPRGLHDLRSTTQCPACFTTLTSQVCADCGLDLGHASAARLATISTEAAAMLERRFSLIADMRARAAAAPVAPVASAPTVPAALARAPVGARSGAAQYRPPRQSSVQVLLLIVGVALVSIAAIFFLVFAFITFGIHWRSVIIAAITLSAFGAASVLKRRGLPSTAEGIGAFAVVLLLLDAFAVRANDLFGAASTDGYAYWGATLVTQAAVLAAWHSLTALRVGSIAAFVLFTPGIGVLLVGLTASLDGALVAFIASLGMVIGGLVHPLAVPLLRSSTAPAVPHTAPRSALPERVIILSITSLALITALLSALFVGSLASGGYRWGFVALAPLLTAAVTALHVVTLARGANPPPALRAFVVGFATVAGVAASAAAALPGYDVTQPELRLGIGAVASSTVALAFVAVANRTHTAGWRPLVFAATAGAAAVAGCALLVPFTVAVTALATVPVRAASAAWSVNATDRIVDVDLNLVSVVAALAATVAVGAAAAYAAGLLRQARAVLAAALAAVAILSVPLLATLWAVAAGWFAIAAVSLAVLLVRRGTRRLPLAVELVLASAAILSVSLAYSSSWASTSTWLAASVVTIGLLSAARSLFPTAGATLTEGGMLRFRAALLACAVPVAVVAAVAGAHTLVLTRLPSTDATMDSLHFVIALGILFIAASLASGVRGVSGLDRALLFGSGALLVAGCAPVSAIVGVITVTPTLSPRPATVLVLAVALLGSLICWLTVRAGADLPLARSVAAVGLAPSTVWVIDSLISVIDADSEARVLAPIAASLLVAAAALVAATRVATTPVSPAGGQGTAPSMSHSRTMADLGVAAGVFGGILTPLAADSEFAWLCLVIASVTVLMLAIGGRGFTRRNSQRRHLGWAALALGVAGLWTWLGSHSETAVEPYVLPLTGALLAIAAASARARRARPTDAASPGIAHHLVLAALLVTVLPIGVASLDGSLTRPVVIAAVSAVFLLTGSVPHATPRARRFLDALALAGVAGLVLVTAGRAAGAGDAPPLGGASLDVWLGLAFAVLVVAALGQARAERAAVSVIAARSLLGAAMALVAAFEVRAADDGAFAWVRIVVLVVLFSGIHVLGAIDTRVPFDRVTGRIGLGLAVLVALVNVRGDISPGLEWVSVPIAVALLTTGAVRLSRDPATRSWPTLGAGLGVLLVLPFIATVDDRPLWRLVAIGVLAVCALVVGLLRRLQAPFLIGAVVALAHGIATFSPQIVAVYQLTEWWWWAAPAGIVIILLGMRLERSIGAAHSLTASIGSLR